MAIDATVGGADADSFVSVAEADTYHADDNVHTTAWAARDTADKEAGLRMATRVIDSMAFIGYRQTTTQALSWPRYNAYQDGVLISSAIVPDRVKWATAELAEWLLAEDRSAPSPGHQIEEAKVGGLRVAFRQDSGGIRADMPELVVHYLRPLVRGSVRGNSGQVRVRR